MVEETTPVADPIGELGASVRAALDGVTAAVQGIHEGNTALVEEIRALRPAPVETPPERNEAIRTGAADTMSDRFDQAWGDPALSREENARQMRSNFEVAGLIFGATRAGIPGVNPVSMPEDFERAWKRHVFEGGSRIMVRDGAKTRAMDTAETGFGLELVGAQYVADLWAGARAQDILLQSIRTIPMTDPTSYVPVDGALPEMMFVAENTANNSSAYTSSKTASNRATLTAKKFTIQSYWSGELEQDSIIQFTPFIREKLQQSLAHFLPSAMYNGDNTNAGTGNINLDDADPVDTKHYLAWDGIRHYWLVDATGQGKDQAGVLDLTEILRARAKLMVMGDDVDDDFNNINWGANTDDLLLVCDFSTYLVLQNNDAFATVDKYGAAATVLTGELGRIFGIRVFAPAYASKTEADGKAAEVETSNTKGQITLFNRRGFLRGERAGVSTYFNRIQGRDQFLLELYTRQAFTRHGSGVAAGIYNLTV